MATFKSKRETKHDIRYNTDDKEYQNLFIPKPVLKPEYVPLF